MHWVTQSCLTLRPHGLQPTGLLCPWDSPDKKTGVGCRFLLQGIFPFQGWNSRLFCFLHWRAILYRCATREAPFSLSGIYVFLTFSISLCPGLWFWVRLFCLLCRHEFSLVLNFSMKKLLVIQEMSLSFWFLHWVLITSCVFTIIRHSWCLLASKPFGGVGALAVYGLTPSISCGSHFGLNYMSFLGIRLLLPLKN